MYEVRKKNLTLREYLKIKRKREDVKFDHCCFYLGDSPNLLLSSKVLFSNCSFRGASSISIYPYEYLEEIRYCLYNCSFPEKVIVDLCFYQKPLRVHPDDVTLITTKIQKGLSIQHSIQHPINYFVKEKLKKLGVPSLYYKKWGIDPPKEDIGGTLHQWRCHESERDKLYNKIIKGGYEVFTESFLHNNVCEFETYLKDK